MEIDIYKLRKAAQEATAGPWYIGALMTVEAANAQYICGVGEQSSNLWAGQRRLNGEYIAQANPTAIIALIDRLCKTEGISDQYKERAEEAEASVESLSVKLKQKEQELESLSAKLNGKDQVGASE